MDSNSTNTGVLNVNRLQRHLMRRTKQHRRRILRLEVLEDRRLLTGLQFATTMVATGGGAKTVAVGDLTGDGRLDIAVERKEGSFSLLSGDGMGGFLTATKADASRTAPRNTLTTVDTDLDGTPEVVTISGGIVRAFRQDASGNYSIEDTIFTPILGSAVGFTAYATGRLNGDQFADFVVDGSNSSNAVQFNVKLMAAINSGNGRSFTPQTIYDFGVFDNGRQPFMAAIATGSLNNDGIDDIAVMLSTNELWTFISNGQGSYTATNAGTVVTSPDLAGSQSLLLTDLNADGRDDLLLVDGRNPGNVYVRINDGSAAIGPQQAYAVGDVPVAIEVADMNGDGSLDVVVANRGPDSGTSAPAIVLPFF